ncbi:hypothetical protein LEM8419_01493 [Neolewinella maritima]|uniref:Lipoyl-binding domain-containing protein n=1 Tax=Neolewinella maritima TaxID=1383882 RepID=A0ABN8F4V6_9BACT|nr:acetyl-CoA carboxylase biotin carboxyl carrier protein subunit [Neolewinella maritima]CAH1000340.1 hypothetical protein LEM8419_01493 [Neolewinella maritima]
MHYTAKVGQTAYEITPTLLDQLDVSQASNIYHLLQHGRGYRCELLHLDRSNRRVDVRINGRQFSVQLDGPLQQLVEQLGFATAPVLAAGNVTAPMPGLILSLNVATGDTVEAGSPLLVLEAMKMENVIKATAPGTVKTIHVAQGQAVDKQQLLIEVE